MLTVQINEAQSRLMELVTSVENGEEIVITRDDKPVARLIASSPAHSLADLQPISVGAVLRPLSPDDDLLEEMTSR
jgi:prevent-host-death family protein